MVSGSPMFYALGSMAIKYFHKEKLNKTKEKINKVGLSDFANLITDRKTMG